MAPLTSRKRTALFKAWCDKQCVQHVADSCAVSRGTVYKYMKRDEWQQRLAEVERQAQAELDESIAEMKARHARYARGLQVLALQDLFGEELDGAGGRTLSELEADKVVKVYLAATGEERVARGEASDRLEILEILQERYRQRHQGVDDGE